MAVWDTQVMMQKHKVYFKKQLLKDGDHKVWRWRLYSYLCELSLFPSPLDVIHTSSSLTYEVKTLLCVDVFSSQEWEPLPVPGGSYRLISGAVYLHVRRRVEWLWGETGRRYSVWIGVIILSCRGSTFTSCCSVYRDDGTDLAFSLFVYKDLPS